MIETNAKYTSTNYFFPPTWLIMYIFVLSMFGFQHIAWNISTGFTDKYCDDRKELRLERECAPISEHKQYTIYELRQYFYIKHNQALSCCVKMGGYGVYCTVQYICGPLNTHTFPILSGYNHPEYWVSHLSFVIVCILSIIYSHSKKN